MDRRYLLVGILLLAALASGCTTQPSGAGALSGQVRIGPLCPVERIPPEPSCQPTSQTYEQWPIGVWTAWDGGKAQQVAELSPSPPGGNYSLALPAGDYIVDLVLPHPAIGARSLPANVTVLPNRTTVLDITIDTGIR